VVFGQGGIHPKTVTYNISIWNLLQLACTDIYVTGRYQGTQPIRSGIHDALIQRQLQLQQVLAYALASFPSKDRYWSENLSTGSVAWQPSALTSGMQQDTLLA
jgi:hypothetical protein